MSSNQIRKRRERNRGGAGRTAAGRRSTTNIFAMFNENQIQEFKQAFDMIDTNKNQIIDLEDLQETFASLGKDYDDQFFQQMLNESTAPINFTMFLTMFGEKLNGTDSEDVIKNAFQCFDDEMTGKISEKELRDKLCSMGNRFTKEQCDLLLKDAPVDESGMLDYNVFSKILKHGLKEKDGDEWVG